MDVSLSIVVGLGLRLFLLNYADAELSSLKLSVALLGLWEGAVVHQISARSSSSNLDHVLAYGLRLAVDLLISKNLQRMMMVVLWSALSALSVELIIPHESLRSALKVEREREREKERERRHRHSRSVPAATPIVPTPLPPRVRAYKAPEPNQPTPILPENPPPQSSTPFFPLERLPTPPSFFLQEPFNTSPSPESAFIPILQPSSPQGALPVRPRSGLASTLDNSPDSGSPLPVPMHLPTPPDSALSAIPSEGPLNDVQSNGTYNDNNISRFEHQLYTIPELPSPEDITTPDTNANKPAEASQPEAVTMSVQLNDAPTFPLPVPNSGLKRMPSGNLTKWLTSQYKDNHDDPEAIFTASFSPSVSPVPPIPFLLRSFDPPHQTLVPAQGDQSPRSQAEEPQGDDAGLEYVDPPFSDDNENDELRTPGFRIYDNIDTDNERDDDPLRTPRQHQDPDGQLSPLPLDVGLRMDNDEYQLSHDLDPRLASTYQGTQQAFDEAHVHEDTELPIPGSLSLNSLLQPPLPPSGSLFRRSSPPPDSPPPPSPSTIHSDPSDVSVLSTRIPTRLYMRADELRKQAREEESSSALLEEERKRAEAEGRVIDALQLKIKIREMYSEADKLHERAARRYFVSRNPLSQPHKIDVHGLRPREAFDRIERAIVQAGKEKRSTMIVIVGKGLHSANQQPTLKPAVYREMQRLKIKCEVHPRNSGQLIITLPQS